MYAGNALGQLGVSDSLTAEIGQGLIVPVAADLSSYILMTLVAFMSQSGVL